MLPNRPTRTWLEPNELSLHQTQGGSRRTGHNRRPDGSLPAAFGRFEAVAVNDMWIADALHGPKIAGRRSYLFAFIDDHSRLIPGYRWGRAEDSLRLEAAFRRGLAARGIPRRLYVDIHTANSRHPAVTAVSRLEQPGADSLPVECGDGRVPHPGRAPC